MGQNAKSLILLNFSVLLYNTELHFEKQEVPREPYLVPVEFVDVLKESFAVNAFTTLMRWGENHFLIIFLNLYVQLFIYVYIYYNGV